MSEHAPPGMTLARIFLLALVAIATLTFLWLVAPFAIENRSNEVERREF